MNFQFSISNFPWVWDYLLSPYRQYSTAQIEIEGFAAVLGVASVVLAARRSIWCYPVGIVSTAIYSVLLYQWHLYGDMLINVYYTAMSLYGWVLWRRNAAENHIEPVHFSQKNGAWLSGIFGASVFLVLTIYVIQSGHFSAEQYLRLTWINYVDSLTASIFLVAMWLMARRFALNWAFWIVGDLIAIPMFLGKGYAITAFQYLLFLFLAIYGYFQWRRYDHATNQSFKLKESSLVIALLLIFCASCHHATPKEMMPTAPFIQPPVKNADIPYTEYAVDAEKGGTLLHKTGSLLVFPPNSFVDKDGNIISGNVQIKYREFASPIDFYLSGIPMNCDSSGVQYAFESAGMCEIHAYKDNLPVFVNPKSKPEINMITQNVSPEQKLYYLDTALQKWVKKGACPAITLNKKLQKNNTNRTKMATQKDRATTFSSDVAMSELPKPEKANNKSPIIELEIDPASFKELTVYDHLKFQLDPSEKHFNPKDTSGTWDNVELMKGANKGLYTVKFSRGSQSVSYLVRPVLEGKDYDRALKIFEEKENEFQQRKTDRLAKEKANRQRYIRDSTAYAVAPLEEKKGTGGWLAQTYGALIGKRDIEEWASNGVKLNGLTKSFATDGFSVRSFAVDAFGVWNFDKPAIPYEPYVISGIATTYMDTKNNPIELEKVALFRKSFNGIFRFYGNTIQVTEGADHMIVGVYKGRFAYITYSEYHKLNVGKHTKEQTFVMQVVAEKDNNYGFIKALVAQ